MDRLVWWMLILICIMGLWMMIIFALGYPSISMFVNRIMRSGFIFATIVKESGTISRTWVSAKNLEFKKNGLVYTVTEKYMRARHGLWHEGVSQQIPWPDSSCQFLKEGEVLDSRSATAVYNSKVAEWLNLIRNNPNLQFILILQVVILFFVLVIVYLSYVDHMKIVQALSIAKTAAQQGGIVV